MKQNISEEMKKNILNYGSEIKTLESYVEAIRQNIGMYIGSKGNHGFINMIREIIQNGTDEINKESSPATDLWVIFDDRTLTCSVEDNGRGIPFNNIIRIFTSRETSSNYTKKIGEYSSGLHGVGAKVTNALSKQFIVDSYVLGEAREVIFIDGIATSDKEKVIPNKENKQGTKITFTPSNAALGKVTVTWKDVLKLIKHILPLSKLGATVHFTGININGDKYEETIINTDGIMTYLNGVIAQPLTKNPIHLFADTGEMKMDIVFTYDTDENSIETVTAFANTCPTQSGYHIDGFFKAIGQYFSNYMNKIYLANSRSKINITPSDTRVGIKAIISVAHLKPVFNGQAKEILANEDMEPFVKSNIINQLDLWSKSNASDMEKICKYLKDVAEARVRASKEREKISNKYKASALSGLPAKYVAPTGNKNLELFICEGDSASGPMRNHRINSTMGYFPIRGKILNAFNTSREKFLSNPEVSGIIAIIGGGYGRNFNIDKVKWERIILATDADADGAHIAALLLKFFLMYMPGLVESGRVYRATPPLYGITKNKKHIYFDNKLSMIKYFQKSFSSSNDVRDINGNPLNVKTLSKILYTNFEYVDEMDIAASNCGSVHPLLLERVLFMKDFSPRAIQKDFKKDNRFRFLKTSERNHIATIEGSFGGDINTLFINKSLQINTKDIKAIINKNESYYYMLNGNIVSLYELMTAFSKYLPSTIQRYKGLGEMDGERLFESTLDPEKRTLLRYTVDDVKDTIEQIRYYETNKAELLTDNVVSKIDFMS